jgi:phosphate transport system substrate-binding protein
MVHRPAEIKGKCSAVLILHGLVGSKDTPHRIFVTLAEALAKAGFISLRVDLVGRGDSEGESVDATPKSDLQNVRDALAALRALPDVEASFVASEIERLITVGRRPRDMAVIYRSNKQAELIEQALRERELAYVLIGGQAFFERKEVKDLLSYLKLAIHPMDEIALRRIINYPSRGIGEQALAKLEAYAIARDGLSVYFNERTTVKELTLAQIADIYTGRITNWKDVGGNDAPIILYSRENSSGTYTYFKDNVLLGKDFSPRAQTLQGTAGVVNAVANDANGIGYGGAAYAKGIKFAAVKKDAKSPAIVPSLETVRSGEYPISRYLYLYTRAKPSKDMKAFIDWATGPEGQAIVTKVGYFPVK